MRSLRFITLVISIIFCSTVAMAQSQGDKLYNQGLQLQKTMTVASQNQAIAKFNKAKSIYDSAAKKSQCDQAIAVSRNIINNLKSGGGGKPGGGSTGGGNNAGTTQTKVTPTLDLSNTSFEIPMDYKMLNVKVMTNQSSWEVKAVPCSDGSSFVRAQKKGDNEIEIIANANMGSSSRTQKVIVTAGDLHKEITVVQNGIPVKLSKNKDQLTFKAKGGTQKMDVSCNSTQKYEANSNANWYVSSKPDWVVITISESKSEGLVGGLLKKGKELINGKTEADNDSSMIKSTISVTAQTCTSASGRTGEIVIKSGDSSITIPVIQQGK